MVLEEYTPIHVTRNDLSDMESEVLSKVGDVLSSPGSEYQSIIHKYGGCISCWEQIHDSLDNIYTQMRENHGNA